MIEVTLTKTALSYTSSVAGLIEATYSETDLIDNYSVHFVTNRGVLLFNVLQHTFNGQSFDYASDLITYIETL